MPRHIRPVRTALVFCAVALPATALAGCGGLSGDAVAKVDGTEITKSDYGQSEKFLRFQASQQVAGGKLLKEKQPKLIAFKAPYADCIAMAKKHLITKEQKKTVTDQQIKDYCDNIAKQLKDGAMSQLLQEQIIAKEAEDEKIKVDDAAINKQLPTTLTQLLGDKKYLPQFTTVTGLNEDVLRDQVKTQLLVQKMQEKVTKDAGKVTDADVKAAYEKNKAQYQQPETRDLEVILTKTKGQAEAAKKAIESGTKFADEAKKASIDEVTKKAGGKLAGVAKGQQEKGLETAAFNAKKGVLVGPIKTETGYYVLRVTKVTPAKTTPFDQVKTMLKQQLQQQKPAEAWTKWQKDVLDKWKDKTDCRDGYNTVVFCKNMPKPKTDTAAATGAAGAASGASGAQK